MEAPSQDGSGEQPCCQFERGRTTSEHHGQPTPATQCYVGPANPAQKICPKKHHRRTRHDIALSLCFALGDPSAGLLPRGGASPSLAGIYFPMRWFFLHILICIWWRTCSAIVLCGRVCFFLFTIRAAHTPGVRSLSATYGHHPAPGFLQ